MALAYNLWTEKDIEERNVVPDGNYRFKIIDSISKKTQGGFDKEGNQKPIRDMLEIHFRFCDSNGNTKLQTDWIVFMEGMDWKMRHLAEATNNLEVYDKKELDCHHLNDKEGTFILGSKEIQTKYGTMKKVNYVKDYVKNNSSIPSSPSNVKLTNDIKDEEIPF